MSSRVAGAGLALTAAALLVVSIASPVVQPELSLYAGHPTVNDHVRELQDVYVTAYEARLCNTGGDGSCTTIDTKLSFRLIGYGDLAATGVCVISATLLALLTLKRSERRGAAALGVRIAGVLGLGATGALLWQGPFTTASAPLGLGALLYGGSVLIALVASFVAVRALPAIRLRVADAGAPFGSQPGSPLGPPLTARRPAPPPIDMEALFGDAEGGGDDLGADQQSGWDTQEDPDLPPVSGEVVARDRAVRPGSDRPRFASPRPRSAYDAPAFPSGLVMERPVIPRPMAGPDALPPPAARPPLSEHDLALEAAATPPAATSAVVSQFPLLETPLAPPPPPLAAPQWPSAEPLIAPPPPPMAPAPWSTAEPAWAAGAPVLPPPASWHGAETAAGAPPRLRRESQQPPPLPPRDPPTPALEIISAPPRELPAPAPRTRETLPPPAPRARETVPPPPPRARETVPPTPPVARELTSPPAALAHDAAPAPAREPTAPPPPRPTRETAVPPPPRPARESQPPPPRPARESQPPSRPARETLSPPPPRPARESQSPPPPRSTESSRGMRAAVPMPERPARPTASPTRPPPASGPIRNPQRPAMPGTIPPPFTIPAIPAIRAIPAIPAIPATPAIAAAAAPAAGPAGIAAPAPAKANEAEQDPWATTINDGSVDLPLDASPAPDPSFETETASDLPVMADPSRASSAKLRGAKSGSPDTSPTGQPTRDASASGINGAAVAAPKLPISTAPDSLPPPKDDTPLQAGPSPACPQCESPMSWVEEHLRFYCKSCRMYF